MLTVHSKEYRTLLWMSVGLLTLTFKFPNYNTYWKGPQKFKRICRAWNSRKIIRAFHPYYIGHSFTSCSISKVMRNSTRAPTFFTFQAKNSTQSIGFSRPKYSLLNCRKYLGKVRTVHWCSSWGLRYIGGNLRINEWDSRLKGVLTASSKMKNFTWNRKEEIEIIQTSC